ncbi:MAG: PaaI family thioesterase, partial [Terracidiphilus sp.]
FEGPAGYLHGGVIATLLDEAMSKSVRATGIAAMTHTMEVDYHRPVHSGAPIRIEGRLLGHEGRKHWTEARILDARGHLLASAKGLFLEVRPR